MRILLADNNDSFTRNLEHCLYAATGHTPQVVPYASLIHTTGHTPVPAKDCAGHPANARTGNVHFCHPQNHMVHTNCAGHGATQLPVSPKLDQANQPDGSFVPSYAPSNYDLIVISPGPGHPCEYTGYGQYIDSGVPVLGICMGLQIINQHFGGETARLAGCVHGKAENITFTLNTGKKKRTKPTKRTVARYHSLYLSRLGKNLRTFAENANGVPMAVQHISRPIAGYQFHPESFLTDDGVWYIRHALTIFGLN